MRRKLGVFQSMHSTRRPFLVGFGMRQEAEVG